MTTGWSIKCPAGGGDSDFALQEEGYDTLSPPRPSMAGRKKGRGGILDGGGGSRQGGRKRGRQKFAAIISAARVRTARKREGEGGGLQTILQRSKKRGGRMGKVSLAAGRGGEKPPD